MDKSNKEEIKNKIKKLKVYLKSKVIIDKEQILKAVKALKKHN